MAAPVCWRCKSTDTELVRVRIQTISMSKESEVFECKHTLACISACGENAQQILKSGYGVKP